MPINISTRTPTLFKRAIHEKKNNSPAGTNKITQSTVAQPIIKKAMHPRSNEISQHTPRRLMGAIGVMRTGLCHVIQHAHKIKYKPLKTNQKTYANPGSRTNKSC